MSDKTFYVDHGFAILRPPKIYWEGDTLTIEHQKPLQFHDIRKYRVVDGN